MQRRDFLIKSALTGAGLFLNPLEIFASAGSWYKRSVPMMGTFVEIAVYSNDEASSNRLISDCFDYLHFQVKQISSWESESETSLLNTSGKVSSSSEAFARMLGIGTYVERTSGSRFRLCVKDLSRLWSEAKSYGVLPNKSDVKHQLARLEKTDLEVKKSEVSKRGADLDCGGVGKGVIADLARTFLHSRGVRYARVDCGGDLSFLGDTEWQVDILHPRKEAFLGQIKLRGDCAVATSGDYLSNWEVSGNSYHHLIDPQTGWPARFCQSATVVSADAGSADALSTAVFLMPAREGVRYLNSLPGAEGLIVSSSGEVFKTKNLSYLSRVSDII